MVQAFTLAAHEWGEAFLIAAIFMVPMTAEVASASPIPMDAFEPTRLAWAYCRDHGVKVPVGVHSPSRLARPSVLGAELLDECMFTHGLVPGEWFMSTPSGRSTRSDTVRASGPLWGVVSELRLGVLSHDVAFTGSVGPTLPNPFHHRHERGVNVSGELIFVSPRILRYLGFPRPRVGASVNLAGYTDDVYADLDWAYASRAGPFAEAFLGGAWHDGALRRENPQRSELGARFLFHAGVEAGWRLHGHPSISVIWEHLSNGSFARPNQGIDRFGIRYGYRFD